MIDFPIRRLEEAKLSAAMADIGGVVKIQGGQVTLGLSLSEEADRGAAHDRTATLSGQRDLKQLREHLARWKNGSLFSLPENAADRPALEAWRRSLTLTDYIRMRTAFEEALLACIPEGESGFNVDVHFVGERVELWSRRPARGQLIALGPEFLPPQHDGLTSKKYRPDFIFTHARAALENTLAPLEEFSSTEWVVERQQSDANTVTVRLATLQEQDAWQAVDFRLVETTVGLAHEDQLEGLVNWLAEHGGKIGGQPGGPIVEPHEATIVAKDYLDDVHRIVYPSDRRGEVVPSKELHRHIAIRGVIGGYQVHVPVAVPRNIFDQVLDQVPGATELAGNMNMGRKEVTYEDPRAGGK